VSTPIQGSKLSPALQARVLKHFIYRWTHENTPPIPASMRPRVQPVSDAEWLRTHAFYLTLTGELDRRRNYCEPFYEEVRQ
jgi:hypothetical protein